MKVYFAGSFADRPHIRQLVEHYCRKYPNIESISRWLWVEPDEINELSPSEKMTFAVMDLEDINRSDLVVLFAGTRWSPGKCTELGYAYAKRKRVVIIDDRDDPPQDNLFANLFERRALDRLDNILGELA